MRKLVIPVLLLFTAVTPAAANWFHNPYENINRNVGSAPNPTPEDLRRMRLPIVTDDQNAPAADQVASASRPAPVQPAPAQGGGSAAQPAPGPQSR